MPLRTEESLEAFQAEVERNVSTLVEASALRAESLKWLHNSLAYRYSYNFSWLGRPIIQYPQDIVAIQELIWRVRPDFIVETGVAHGGSLILSASMLALLDYCDAISANLKEQTQAPKSSRRVIGVDIDIRRHNRTAIESHPLAHKISLIEGSSVDSGIVEEVRGLIGAERTVLVVLDSNHTYEHVERELHAYGPLVTVGSYCVVFDTIIENLPKEIYPNRAWGPGNSPLTAVNEFIAYSSAGKLKDATGRTVSYVIDDRIDGKLQISTAPRGYLRRVT